MKKIILTIFATFILSLSVSAQSGAGRLKGFVASGIKNGSAIEATIELQAIENNSKTNFVDTVQTKDGGYDFEVSFGYYLLTISAKGYETYQTKVDIPSSSTINLTTILNKSTPKVDKCVSGNCVKGAGKMVYANGDIYEGNFVNRKKEGQGTFTVKYVKVYIGQFADNAPNGKGKATFANGDIYVGNWVDGKQTKGKITRANGHIYEGDWVGDQETGKGKKVYSNGKIYEGDFVAGYEEGQGTCTYTDGDYYTGQWKGGSRHGKGKYYDKAKNTIQEGTWEFGNFVGK